MRADRIIYFDNAATSFPKPKCVIDSVNECLKDYCGNPSRSSHSLSIRASQAVYEARCNVAELFDCDAEEKVVFTSNATHAINLAIKTLITEPCHILTSDIEHNSVIRPLEKQKSALGVSYSLFDSDSNIKNEILRLKRRNTKYVISTICSNVSGKIIDIGELSSICRSLDLGLIIDASQAAGHIPINIKKNKLSAICAPAHKSLFGIQGSGFVIFGEAMPKDTIIEGGSGSFSISKKMPRELPDMLEAGTPNVPACAALSAGINYIRSVGIEQINHRIQKIRAIISEKLRNMDNVRVIGDCGAILSFNIGNIPSSRIAGELDDLGICTRSGLHCSPSAHKKYGTLDQGAVRLSFSYFNTEKEAEIFSDSIYEISKRYAIRESKRIF